MSAPPEDPARERAHAGEGARGSASAVPSGGPWARFAHAFRTRPGARRAWRGLLAVVGLAVFAPLLANERPWLVRFRAAGGGAEWQREWPLPASLGWLELSAMLAWLGVALYPLAARALGARGVRQGLLRIALAALALGGGAALVLDAPRGAAWEARVLDDPGAVLVRTLIPFGPHEVDLARALEAPLAGPGTGPARAAAPAHWLGTDALGRDLLARLLWAGRTSFAVALVAAALILGLGTLLGLAAGVLRGVVDALVSRAVELLQAFPTLVLLLGMLALLPARHADSRWSLPLLIGLFGWGHVARLARAEALRVRESGFVQAAVASGFSRPRVLLAHVLPNALGPVWIAASFVVSAGLVLESSAAFLGFGVQLPAPSFGALLADARATQAWWLALFPGLWLCAAILAIHLVGEGVRDALDPRDARGAP